MIRFIAHSFDETRALGQKIGESSESGTVIALTGDLGSGKTALVQGLAAGLDILDDYVITSPTYTFINEYPGRLPLFHVDLYRATHVNDLEDIGFYEIFHDESIVAIEWADKLPKNFLQEYLHAHLEILGDNDRKIILTPHGKRALDLLDHLKKQFKDKKWD